MSIYYHPQQSEGDLYGDATPAHFQAHQELYPDTTAASGLTTGPPAQMNRVGMGMGMGGAYPNQAHPSSNLYGFQQQQQTNTPPNQRLRYAAEAMSATGPAAVAGVGSIPGSMAPPTTAISMNGSPTGLGMQQQQQQHHPNQMRHGQQHMQVQQSMANAYSQPQSAFNTVSVPPSYYSQPPSSAYYSAHSQSSPSPSAQASMATSISMSQPPAQASFSQPLPPSSNPQAQQAQQRPVNSVVQKPILQPPLSPASAKLESQRVTALLEINRALLHEIVLLQAAGRAGAPAVQPGQAQTTSANSTPGTVGGAATSTGTGSDSGKGGSENGAETPKKEASDAAATTTNGTASSTTPAPNTPTTATTPSDPSKPNAKTPVSSREYIECMRRLQSNLAYLASIADRLHKPPGSIPPCPAIMDAPPNYVGNVISEEGMSGLRKMYEELKGLYGGVIAGAGGVGGNMNNSGVGAGMMNLAGAVGMKT
ncbi:MAG: hypothetical protein MMC33_005008 [Icmadophila ericetorum]|nr:hypothetical protein [Icmadophila ericetorum]